MPAVYGARLTTFEDSEKESEYGYVRKTYGAVCLDGSPPAYHWDKGFGAGINNWLVHIEGGGWCNNVTLCLNHSKTRLGSSKHMDKAINFTGILSKVQNYNPDFYNWNRIKIRYCDGASFIGDVEAINPVTLRSGSWTIRRS